MNRNIDATDDSDAVRPAIAVDVILAKDLPDVDVVAVLEINSPRLDAHVEIHVRLLPGR